MKVQEFSDKYHLGITFESLGVEEDYYGGILWQTKLTSLGHAIVNYRGGRYVNTQGRK